MEDSDRAISAYENALRFNPYSVPAISAIAGVHRGMDRFGKAVEYFQRVLQVLPESGETWGAMGESAHGEKQGTKSALLTSLSRQATATS